MKHFSKAINSAAWLTGMLVALSLFAGAAAAQDLQIDTAVIAQNVVDRAPVDPGTSFPASVGRLYCFTKIVGAQSPTEVTHVWYYGDVERARVTLSVGVGSWRTYSSKVIQTGEIGAWQVQVVDTLGNVLETLSFEITG